MFSKALVIDDDKSARKLVQYFFEKMGYETIEASNGELGSLRLLNDVQDILILDWRMPNLSGGDMLVLVDSIFKQASITPIISPIPIILYTSVPLDDLDLPETKFFRIKGYVHKKWPIDLQKRYFKRIMKSLHVEAA